jgi:hypothetical protein
VLLHRRPLHQRSLPLYLCRPFVEAALVKGNPIKTIVMLPKVHRYYGMGRCE